VFATRPHAAVIAVVGQWAKPEHLEGDAHEARGFLVNGSLVNGFLLSLFLELPLRVKDVDSPPASLEHHVFPDLQK